MDKLFRAPSMHALQALVEVADTGNFTEAATRLCLTQSAVSRKIQQLESHYGVALLLRSSRNVALTAEGKEVLASARRLLTELQSLQARLVPQDRPLRIRIHVSLAVRWLLPRLTDFYHQHPDLTLSIETVATAQVDPSHDCDACIVYLPTAPADPAQHTLFEETLVPVCAPGLVDGKPAPASLDALAHYPLIHGSTEHLEWACWLKANGQALSGHRKHVTFNLDELALDAASRGLGIAMTDLALAQEQIDRGDLIIPFGPALKTGGVYALWMQPASTRHPARQAVLDWFSGQSSVYMPL
ncbi:LysR substrate-binding domain-containing protein [Pseudomonas tussilaginis]|uniref:LysR substrate-binding domain-containing protein n=1 Tax=Pseudomonas putida TaxID=303 RepID=UPI0023647CFA|nr:LysR substrate-binding domain-containing protein [Pseudomonas putida]MDD1979061.1 LysR substrate-binding domain-containing protein [Pseudomonas putida]